LDQHSINNLAGMQDHSELKVTNLYREDAVQFKEGVRKKIELTEKDEAQCKGPSTLTTVSPNSATICRRIRRQSPFLATVAEFGDSRRFRSPVWTGLKRTY